MGVASGWNLWVLLECIGVVSECCKAVYRYTHNNYYISLLHLHVLALILAAASQYISLFIFKLFFRSCLCYFCAML